jgi:N utilization substance protein B
LAKEFDKTTNWDSDRIEVDTIILKWPFVNFEIPSIPFKVTLNEYLELAKEYSTKKQYFLSTVF